MSTNESGNATRLRVALETCLCLFETIPHVLIGTTVRERVEAALAEPPRNCDVGNAEEQYRRFVEFCHKADECSACILSGMTESECALHWGELPFGTENNEKQMQDCTNCGTNRDECERENATRYGVCGNWTKKEEKDDDHAET